MDPISRHNEMMKRKHPIVKNLSKPVHGGRIFISLKDQEEHMEIQRARHEQGEQLGKPVDPIEGQKPPVKFDIGKEFMAEGGNKFKKEMQREFMLRGAKKSSQSVERNKNEIKKELSKVHELQ